MQESQISRNTDGTRSYHIEQILTNQVLIIHARALLILTLVAFGSALQLLIFAVICLFFEGSPYLMALACSLLFILNTVLLYYFIRHRPLRSVLISCIISTSISFILCAALFFWTAYLVYGEDKQIRREGFDFSKADLLTSNRIVVNTRVAMYSLHMILTPIQALCCAAILYILYKTLRSLNEGEVTRGYFITKPVGHQ
uniref:Transmembrane protein n=1 Tax=Acrobeloides nanus TaxID=290746 RepID=A0A914CJ23_9BILA